MLAKLHSPKASRGKSSLPSFQLLVAASISWLSATSLQPRPSPPCVYQIPLPCHDIRVWTEAPPKQSRIISPIQPHFRLPISLTSNNHKVQMGKSLIFWELQFSPLPPRSLNTFVSNFRIFRKWPTRAIWDSIAGQDRESIVTWWDLSFLPLLPSYVDSGLASGAQDSENWGVSEAAVRGEGMRPPKIINTVLLRKALEPGLGLHIESACKWLGKWPYFFDFLICKRGLKIVLMWGL